MWGFVHVSFANATLDFCLRGDRATGAGKQRAPSLLPPQSESVQPKRMNVPAREEEEGEWGQGGARRVRSAPSAEREHLLQGEVPRDPKAAQMAPQLLVEHPREAGNHVLQGALRQVQRVHVVLRERRHAQLRMERAVGESARQRATKVECATGGEHGGGEAMLSRGKGAPWGCAG